MGLSNSITSSSNASSNASSSSVYTAISPGSPLASQIKRQQQRSQRQQVSGEGGRGLNNDVKDSNSYGSGHGHGSYQVCTRCKKTVKRSSFKKLFGWVSSSSSSNQIYCKNC